MIFGRFLHKSTVCIFISLSFSLSIVYLICKVLPYNYKIIRPKVHCDKSSSGDEKFLLFPMFTITSNSGLGNQLFEVFSLLGLAKTINRTAILNQKDWILHHNFQSFQRQSPLVSRLLTSIPIKISESTRYVYPDSCCHYQLPSLLLCEQAKFLVIDGKYFQSYKYFSEMENYIKEMLKPSENEKFESTKSLTNGDVNKYKICVHIRRGDFLTDGDHVGTDDMFTINAINYLYSKNPGIVFLFSNDKEWVDERIVRNSMHREDMRIMNTSSDEPFVDLHFSQLYCDSFLITAPSSTFGWWLGYLSKNQDSVFYRDIRELNEKVKYQMNEDDFFPASWNKMGISQNGSIIMK